MTGNPLLTPIAEENSKQSEEAVFQEYDHETYLKRRFSSEDEDNKNKSYIRLSELTNDWYCSGKFLLVLLGFIILIIILVILVYNRII
jgi:hypothetical protein